jgi:acetyl-CoA carboxylase biotin carboxylase subunit
VTEFVTGLDLVHLQIHVASGGTLPFTQDDVKLRGHAIECRVYAEDPDNNFFPSPGEIKRLIQPGGPGIREDCGVYEGWHVPLDYDPMLSKLIAYAPSRAQAIARLERALDEYFIGGIKTNLSLFRRILADQDFRAGHMDTGMLDRMLAGTAQAPDTSPEDLRAAAIAAAFFAYANGASQNAATNAAPAEAGKWRSAARRESLRNEVLRG